mmetsp:Transcript_4484/g.11498  ORF Transcript_4484/g.11498 Transcript_4484/m.11498 type:complete len:241 (+) Transcript_4484:414-1136(+)
MRETPGTSPDCSRRTMSCTASRGTCLPGMAGVPVMKSFVMKVRMPIECAPGMPKGQGKSTTGTCANLRINLCFFIVCVTISSACCNFWHTGCVSVVGVTSLTIPSIVFPKMKHTRFTECARPGMRLANSANSAHCWAVSAIPPSAASCRAVIPTRCAYERPSPCTPTVRMGSSEQLYCSPKPSSVVSASSSACTASLPGGAYGSAMHRMRMARPGPGKGWRQTRSSDRPSCSPNMRTSSL